MTDVEVVAEGLQFPEGPVALSDGSVLVVEIARGTLSRVTPDGAVDVVAEPGGGPNGCAIGPDGKAYLTNNGGCFTYVDVGGITVPGPGPPEWTAGSVQRVDLDSGEVETLYDACEGRALRAPNDLVFDTSGGFWFTDHGVRLERTSDRTGGFYAAADGSSVREVIFPLGAPNGVGLAPDGSRLYVAETHTGRVWQWAVTGPGEVVADNPLGAGGGELLAGLAGMQLLDSLAVDAEGWDSGGTLGAGGITQISPDGATVDKLPFDDPLVTNLCFGGPDLRTAYVTCSGTGRLVALEWPRPGLPLAHTR